MNHAQARAILAAAAPALSPAESLAVRCVALHETRYGGGWKGVGVGSNNWGAITKAMPCDESDGFMHADSRPNGQGGVIHYETCFRRYPTPEAGAADVARVVLKANVREAISSGRGCRGVAEEMYRNKYYTGTSSIPEVNIQRYTDALEKAKRSITAGTGEQDSLAGGGKGGMLLLAAAVAAYLLLRNT